MTRVLIIGLGSIGHKHLNALVDLGIDDIAALRTGLGQKKVEDKLCSTLTEFYNIDDALDWKPTHFIISNPTGLHIEFINIAIKNNIKFFVEKPIADSVSDLDRLEDITSELGFVGYNLRFNPLFMEIKKVIDSKRFGDVITAKLHVGQYLPSWHPYEDYTKAYYSRKDLGGGALRTLSHEIDLIQFFFGKVKTVYANVEKISDLNIDVDDVVNVLAQTENCKRVSVHINYLDPVIDRSGAVYFNEGVLKYDYLTSEAVFVSNKGKKTTLFLGKSELKDQYKLQMNAFVNNVDKEYSCTFDQGINVMKIIDACELATKEKKEICLV